MEKAIRGDQKVMMVFMPAKWVTNQGIITPSRTPITPPAPASVTVSTRDFVELNPFLFETAAAHLAKNFAVTGLGGFQRDEHAVGGGPGILLGFVGLDSFAGRFHHADDLVVIAADADVFADGRIEREEGP